MDLRPRTPRPAMTPDTILTITILAGLAAMIVPFNLRRPR
jgi:hypothetical protein